MNKEEYYKKEYERLKRELFIIKMSIMQLVELLKGLSSRYIEISKLIEIFKRKELI